MLARTASADLSRWRACAREKHRDQSPEEDCQASDGEACPPCRARVRRGEGRGRSRLDRNDANGVGVNGVGAGGVWQGVWAGVPLFTVCMQAKKHVCVAKTSGFSQMPSPWT